MFVCVQLLRLRWVLFLGALGVVVTPLKALLARSITHKLAASPYLTTHPSRFLFLPCPTPPPPRCPHSLPLLDPW